MNPSSFSIKPDILKHVDAIAAVLQTVGDIASSPNIGANDITAYLKRTTNSLRERRIRSSILGVTNAGKTTTLNALLGNTFFPSKIKSCVAKEVKIQHSSEAQPSTLYAIKMKDDTPVHIESRREEIVKHLTDLNAKGREHCSTDHEMILHAPFMFLRETEHVDFELSYTPYLFETSIKSANIASECHLSLMEKCAYVFILNFQFLESVSESQIFRLLATVTMRQHTELCEVPNVNRLLILVNALDVVYFDDSPGSLKAENISEYISDYLANPKMLGIKIPPEHIIPYSAKWALVSRIWLSNPQLLDPHSESDKDWYEEALLLLRRAGYKERVSTLKTISEENVRIVSSLLLELSQIETIEEELRDMFYENSSEILHEAAVYNNVAVIQSLETRILKKAEEQNLDRKQELLLKHDQLYDSVIQVKEQEIQSLQRIPGTVINEVTRYIDLTVDSLLKSTDGHIGSILMQDLHEFRNRETQQEVVKRLRNVKTKVAESAEQEQGNTWTSISSIVRSTQEQQVKNELAQLKLQVMRTFKIDTASDSQFPSLQKLSSHIASQVIEALDKLDPIALLVDFPTHDQQINMTFISDDELKDYVMRTSKTKWRTEYRTKKKKSGFLGLGRKRVKWSESVPHEVTVHSPDIAGLKSTFSTEGSSQWVQSFRRRVDEVISQTSQELVNEATKSVTKMFFQAENSLQQTLGEMRDEEQKSKAIVEDLHQRQKQLTEAKTKLLALQ